MRLLLLATLTACTEPPVETDTDTGSCEPVWQGTQIGEPDCEYASQIVVRLRDGSGAALTGEVHWAWLDSCPPTEDTLVCDGDCAVWDAPAGEFEITATVGEQTRSVSVTLDDDDLLEDCSGCCPDVDVRMDEVELVF